MNLLVFLRFYWLVLEGNIYFGIIPGQCTIIELYEKLFERLLKIFIWILLDLLKEVNSLNNNFKMQALCTVKYCKN